MVSLLELNLKLNKAFFNYPWHILLKVELSGYCCLRRSLQCHTSHLPKNIEKLDDPYGDGSAGTEDFPVIGETTDRPEKSSQVTKSNLCNDTRF
jgi:hypothetical protein